LPSQKRAEPEIVALVELDLRKVRVRFVLARQAIRERMRELEGSGNARAVKTCRIAADSIHEAETMNSATEEVAGFCDPRRSRL